MMRWETDQEYAFLVRSGQLELRPGMHLTHGQLAALGMTTPPIMSQESLRGAPGSYADQHAATDAKRLVAASSALQRRQDQEAAAQCSGSVTSRLAAKVETQLQRSGAWQRHEARHQQHVFENARLSPTHAVAASLEHATLPTVTAANADPDDIGSRFTRRILDQFRSQFRSQEVPLSPGPTVQERDTVTQQIAALRESVERLVVLVEALAAGEATVSPSIKAHLAAVSAKHRRLMGLA